MKNVLIVSGGSFDANRMGEYIKKNNYDYIIAADSGGEYAASLGLKTDLLIGDFDSISVETFEYLKQSGCRIREFDSEKDETDFDIALKEAVALNPDKITIIGGTGTRLDHTMTTFFCMMRILETGIRCEIIDSHNKIYLKGEDFSLERKDQYGDFISLVPVTDDVTLSISGMKYNLDNKKVKRGESLCQSNEIVDDVAYIRVSGGVVAVFESMD